ncbi:MAG TPA: class III extradiol ring-cleavage dioxygenase [Coleofasciculaceae cyanobacterium]
MTLPAVFVSHGAPDLPLRSGAATTFLKQLGQQFAKPKAILVISAHWSTPSPLVSAASQPQTIHDFSGFPDALYQLTYPVAGAPELAERVVKLLADQGLNGQLHPSRGLDHGAWIPLMLAYPLADIPVTQLSIQYGLDPEQHFRMGQALEPLRHEGVLILASGGATHNLRAFIGDYHAAPPEWVQQFDDWLEGAIATGNLETLLNYRHLAPYAVKNHPTDEHLLPLFVALGAGGDHRTRLHNSFTYGAFSMAAYTFA